MHRSEVWCDELHERYGVPVERGCLDGNGATAQTGLGRPSAHPRSIERLGLAREGGKEEVMHARHGGIGGGRVHALMGETGEELAELGVVGVAGGDVNGSEAHGTRDISDEFGGAREGASGEPAVVACEGVYLL